MNNNKLILCLCLILSLLFTACTVQKNVKNTGNQKKQEQIDTESTGRAGNVKQDLQGMMEIATRGCKIAKEGEDIQLDSMSYRVNKVTLTKHQGDWIDISGEEAKLDSNKNIIGDETYVVVNVTVKKTAECEFWWNSLWLDSFTEDSLAIGPRELVSTSLIKYDDPNDPKNNDIYRSDIKVGDEITTDLIYVVNQKEIEPHIHFLLNINPDGASLINLKPDRYCMIYLASLEGAFNEATIEK